MGIKGFFRWLSGRYPLIIRSFSDTSRPVINNLYIDFNQILFAAQKMCVDPNNNALLTNEALRYLDSIVQFVRPTTLIFIAIDGTPPFNKIYNQRLEKHKNFWNNPPNFHGEGVYPDLALFFPGTPFIHNFQKELRDFIKNKTTNDAAWMNPQVIYSSVYNPGESEHKIFEFIQKRSNLLKKQKDASKLKNKSNEVHCIFSTDNDIIPLIMLTPENNFLLMRPIFIRKEYAQFFLKESEFDLIYINILREYLIKEHIEPELKYSDLDPNLKKVHTNMRLRNIFSDWVFLISLVGNDFFNGFSYFTESDDLDLFESLLDLYEETILNKNLSLLDKEKKEIKLNNFAILLKAFLDHIGEKVDEKNYNDAVSKECEKLLDNLHWILEYYLDKCPSWSYYYSCSLNERTSKQNVDSKHLLTFSDLYIFIQKLNESKTKSYDPPLFEDESNELTPYEYILSHFPDWQKFLPNAILDRVQKFMNDYQRKYGNTDLNMFSYEDIKQVVQDSLPNISKNDIKRNYSTNEFLVIDNGVIQYLSLDNITLKLPSENVWIPSLNKINDFFQNAKSGNRLIPTNFFDLDEYPLDDLKDYIVNKVILVDYPFLKPFIVKSVKMEKRSNLKVPEGINIGKSPILTVIGYPIVISSTDRSSTVICSQLESYPYCLTAPLVPKLNIVLEIMKMAHSKINMNHRVLITNDEHFCQIAKITNIDHQNQIATVKLIKTHGPNLDKFFKAKHHIIKDTSYTAYSQGSLELLEDILENSTLKEKETKTELQLSFNEIIWEGKGVEEEQHAELGDRVISITHGGPIEFGQFGTVVSCNFRSEEVSVVFDNVCQYGSILYNKLKTTRGIIGKTYDFYIIKMNNLKEDK